MSQSQMVALIVPSGARMGAHPERAAAMLVRRADGQFALAALDIRLVRAARRAAAFGKR